MRLNNSHRRYGFVAIYPLAGRDCLFTGVSAHDSVFDFSHQRTHSWPRERSSAIRNLRPAPARRLWNHLTSSSAEEPRANFHLTLTVPWYRPASVQQGEVRGFSRTMRSQMREWWDSTAFHLFLGILPSGFPLSIRPSRTRFFVISDGTDGWILFLFADGPGSSRDRCRAPSLPTLPFLANQAKVWQQCS